MPSVYHVVQLPFPSLSIEHVDASCICEGKCCTGCQQVQCYGCFHRYVRAKDGYRSLCKVCRKVESQTEEFKAKRRSYHKEHADQINKQKRALYSADPEKHQRLSKESRERHPEQVRAYQQTYNKSERGKEREKKYRENHLEKVKETHKKSWQKHHKQRIAQMRAYHARARTSLTGVGGQFTRFEWEALKAQYNYTCPSCKRQEPDIQLTVDHKRPVSKLGSSNIENIQPLCLSCNSRKGTKIINYSIEEDHCG